MIGLDISVKDSSEQERANALDRMPTGWLESVGTVFDLANENAPYKALKRGIKRTFAEYRDGEIVSMAELNEKYAPIGLSFMGDHKQAYVDLLVEKRLDDMKKENIISRGPQNVFAKGSYFISGLGGSFTDVINIGTSVIPIVGQARMIQLVGKYGKTSARIRRGAIEGGIGNTLFEPLEISLAKSEQRDYGAMDSIYNIAFGTLLGSGLQVGFGKIGDVYKRYTGKDNIYNDIENAPVELKEDLIKYSVGQLMQGKRINASAFLEETKLQRNKELRIQQINQTQLKANLGTITDVETQPATKDVKGVKEFSEKIQQKIESSLPKEQKIELQKLKKQYDSLEKKLQQKKYKKVTESKEEIDIDIVNKDKSLIPYIAKLNSLNKKIKTFEDRGQNSLIRNFIKEQQEMKQKGSNVSYNTLGKLEELRQIHSNADGFEIKNGAIVNRANKLNLNPLSDTELLLRNSENSLESTGKVSDARGVNSQTNNTDNLEVATSYNLIKQINVESVKEIQESINQLTDEFSGLENLARDKFPATQDFLNKVNAQIRDIDNTMSKEDDLLKGIQVGYSCLIRKGL